MTSRTLNRELIIHKDLALGIGTALQTRGTAPQTAEQLIELDFIFRTTAEIRALDINRYSRISLHTVGPLTHYFFDPTSAAIDDDNTIIAPVPAIAVGRWIRVTSNSASLNYESVADLIADTAVLTGIAPNTQVSVSGYYTPGDFGGGAFYWDALSSAAHDGGMTLTPTGRIVPGRWIRIITTFIDVHHFGAVGDGVTNDRAPIENAMLAAANNGMTLTIRDLSYEVSGLDLLITNNFRIIGNGFPRLLNGTKLTFTGDYVNFVRIVLVDWSGGINLEPINPGTYDFDQLSVVNCAYGVRSIGASFIVNTLRVRGGWFNGAILRHAYYFEGKVQIVDIENVKIENIGSIADNNITVGIGLSTVSANCETVIIRNCEIKGLLSAAGIRCNAIQISGERIVISNNIIRDINGTGEGKAAIDIIANNCVIANNSITNGGESLNGGWIDCTSSGADNNFVIANNILEGETSKNGNCMYLAGVGTVNGNRMFGDTIRRAMTLVGQPSFKQFTITNNYINCPAASAGIYCVEVYDSTICDNHILTSVYAIQAGAPIATYSILNTNISDNYLKADKGISFTEAADVTIDNNIFDTVLAEIEGNYKYTWWFLDGIMTTTSAKLAAIGDIVNTMQYKKIGLMIWDETLGKPVYAAGAAAGSLWVDSAGVTVHTPV